MTGRRFRKPAKPMTREQVIHAVIVTGSLAALAFAVGVWALVAVVLDQNGKIDALYVSATANRAKLVAVGEQPVGPPPEQIIGQPGPPGQPGAPGADGAAGAAGRDGRDGKDASPAQVAAAVAAYMAAHPPKPGPSGVAGRDGRDGLSPACLAEADECRGPAGPAGADGAAGSNGADGRPPAAWRWTDPATGTAYDCSRDPATPDSAPVYACAAVR